MRVIHLIFTTCKYHSSLSLPETFQQFYAIRLLILLFLLCLLGTFTSFSLQGRNSESLVQERRRTQEVAYLYNLRQELQHQSHVSWLYMLQVVISFYSLGLAAKDWLVCAICGVRIADANDKGSSHSGSANHTDSAFVTFKRIYFCGWVFIIYVCSYINKYLWLLPHLKAFNVMWKQTAV